MYLDNGDELLAGTALENYATFEALQVLPHILQGRYAVCHHGLPDVAREKHQTAEPR